jgi:hypothetical protein
MQDLLQHRCCSFNKTPHACFLPESEKTCINATSLPCLPDKKMFHKGLPAAMSHVT